MYGLVHRAMPSMIREERREAIPRGSVGGLPEARRPHASAGGRARSEAGRAVFTGGEGAS